MMRRRSIFQACAGRHRNEVNPEFIQALCSKYFFSGASRVLLIAIFLSCLLHAPGLSNSVEANDHEVHQPSIYLPLAPNQWPLEDSLSASRAARDGMTWIYHGDAAQVNPNALIYDAASQTLWAGTDAGLIAWRSEEGMQKRYGAQNGLPSSRILSLALGSDGRLWAGTDAGLAFLDSASRWSKAGIPHVGLREPWLDTDTIRSIAILPSSDLEAPEDALWALLQGHLSHRDHSGVWGQPEALPRRLVATLDGAADLLVDRKGGLWLGTRRGTVSAFEPWSMAVDRPAIIHWKRLPCQSGADPGYRRR